VERVAAAEGLYMDEILWRSGMTYRPGAESTASPDLALLLLDEQRVVVGDATSPPCVHHVYADLVGELARIARGLVTIADVEQTQPSRAEGATVSFTMNGRRCSFRAIARGNTSITGRRSRR